MAARLLRQGTGEPGFAGTGGAADEQGMGLADPVAGGQAGEPSESHENAMPNGVPDAARPHFAGRFLPSAPRPTQSQTVALQRFSIAHREHGVGEWV